MLIVIFEGHENLLRKLKHFDFVPQVDGEKQRVSVTNGKKDEGNVGPRQFANKFLKRVKNRLANNDDIRGYDDFLKAMMLYLSGELKEGTLYKKVCRTLYGHIDLVLELESTLNQDDSDHTRWKINTFRTLAKKYYLEKRCKSAMNMLEQKPEELTEDQLRCIQEIYFSDFESDLYFSDYKFRQKLKRDLRQRLMRKLEEDPQGVYDAVVPSLVQTLERLTEGRPVEEEFFDKILALPVPRPASGNFNLS
ncbi:OLC1v1024111C1 [Oldenlandia corymbosa var. corymbosa]|uniref:OLC1v1024111C1 n=1 Tax=Oldenlandia corymbosa var. corymbosa TaxID=529605 RepID=A0AAV1C1I3_OLDCO|nr:OLC1v1024111C1 [Oldenlandia corymbosa var. corymbosa]